MAEKLPLLVAWLESNREAAPLDPLEPTEAVRVCEVLVDTGDMVLPTVSGEDESGRTTADSDPGKF